MRFRRSQYTILKDQNEFHSRQECIPVGCVLSAAVAILGLGCLPRGCLQRGGVCLRGVGVFDWGMSVCQGVLPGGVHLPTVDRQTPVKT